MRIFGQLLLGDKQKVVYLYKTTSKEKFLHKTYATAVAVATMAFQDGGYFGFKVIYLVNDIGDHRILFKKMISLSIINYFDNLKNSVEPKKNYYE
jgi:hypothetical protein